MAELKTYTGFLKLGRSDDSDDVLFLSTIEQPLAEELKWMCGKKVTVQYWITEKQATKDEAQIDFMRRLFGVADAVFRARYSDITGYLWTDEELYIGGHDLMTELKSYIGEWLILEIETS